jgi:hypothetical protein
METCLIIFLNVGNPKGLAQSKGIGLGNILFRSKVRISLGANNSLRSRLLANLESYPLRVEGLLCTAPGITR